jgi:tetratricopeptide (TPR) repeat protein
MGFRFFKRLNITKGVTLNLSKSGGSMSVGPRGAKFTLGPQGARVSLGIPGTGLYYTTNFSLGKLGKLLGYSSDAKAADTTGTQAPTEASTSAPAPPASAQAPASAVPEKDRLTPDHFDKLSLPDDQKALAAGCQALANGNEDAAFAQLQQATHLADGAFLAGFLALKKGRLDEAINDLTAAAGQQKELGRYLSNYGVAATMSLAITEQVSAHIEPNLHGVLLALAEAYQAQKRPADAIATLEQLRQLTPDDVVVKLSLAELLLEGDSSNKETLQRVVKLTEGIENESAVHATLLLYKAQALRELGLLDAAADVLTGALTRKKDRPDELLRALRYERALVYEKQGQAKRARTELEKIYAEDPNYEDVAARLKV